MPVSELDRARQHVRDLTAADVKQLATSTSPDHSLAAVAAAVSVAVARPRTRVAHDHVVCSHEGATGATLVFERVLVRLLAGVRAVWGEA